MDTILELVKARLGRMDTVLDTYFREKIDAAIEELEENGIRVRPYSARDRELVTDLVVWKYQNRDKPDAMPLWLKTVRRERWMQDPGLRRKEGLE